MDLYLRWSVHEKSTMFSVHAACEQYRIYSSIIIAHRTIAPSRNSAQLPMLEAAYYACPCTLPVGVQLSCKDVAATAVSVHHRARDCGVRGSEWRNLKLYTRKYSGVTTGILESSTSFFTYSSLVPQ